MQMTQVIATPRGDRAFGPELAGRPLDGCPEVTYGRYFDALLAVLARDGWAVVRRAVAEAGGPESIEELDRLVVRSEKHGALYHPASATAVWDGGTVRLCLNVAATPVAVACLEQEAATLGRLRERFAAEFLPRPLAVMRVGALAVLVEEWFAGYHEFHWDGADRVRLWDFDAGERLLSRAQALAIYAQAARILTWYFDPATGAGIGPWRHAAGDFVARVTAAGVDVRLITVRGYGAAGDFAEAGPMAERLAWLAFFLNMTMAMRLDRTDGVGAVVLAGEDVAEAAVAGFAAALEERPDVRGEARGVVSFLASFTAEELAGAAEHLAESVAPDEAALVTAAWPAHAAALGRALAALTAEGDD